MKILAIETSCDETSIAITNTVNDKMTVLSHVIHTQIKEHAQYGGVYPSVAKREHKIHLTPVLIRALHEADWIKEKLETDSLLETRTNPRITEILEREPELLVDLESFFEKYEMTTVPDAIAVTAGPGLAPALWVGVNFAKALSIFLNVPIIPVDHMEGHLLSPAATGNVFTIQPPQTPLLSILISGGHTQIVYSPTWGEYKILGSTKDDAIGEAFDKVARMLGLSYPGGPKISKLAQDGKPNELIKFPRPMNNKNTFDMSFSGLKTAVKYFINEHENQIEDLKNDIAYDFEQACADIIAKRLSKALAEYDIKHITVASGVASNQVIKNHITKLVQKFNPNITVSFPSGKLSTDNAQMIAMTAELHNKDSIQPSNVSVLAADANKKIDADWSFNS